MGETSQGDSRFIDLDVPDGEVLLSVVQRVATVTLNRPDRLNATTPTLPYSVARAMRIAADDTDVRAIVITGAGRAFCAGADRSRLEAGRDFLQSGIGERESYPPTIPATSTPSPRGRDRIWAANSRTFGGFPIFCAWANRSSRR